MNVLAMCILICSFIPALLKPLSWMSTSVFSTLMKMCWHVLLRQTQIPYLTSLSVCLSVSQHCVNNVLCMLLSSCQHLHSSNYTTCHLVIHFSFFFQYYCLPTWLGFKLKCSTKEQNLEAEKLHSQRCVWIQVCHLVFAPFRIYIMDPHCTSLLCHPSFFSS